MHRFVDGQLAPGLQAPPSPAAVAFDAAYRFASLSDEEGVLSRIILACDALHAMTSDRPYRAAMPAAEALDELRRHAGTQFDPAVVEALLELVASDPVSG